MKRKGSTYDKNAKRGGGPVFLDYDPLKDGENIQRFLSDLVRWVLSGRLKSRQASTCRGIVETWLHAADLPELRAKMEEMEDTITRLRTRYPDAFRTPEEIAKADSITSKQLTNILKRLPIEMQDAFLQAMKDARLSQPTANISP